jgi:predicted transcriptional regulator
MDTVFLNAKERPPANFPRDIKKAIKGGWIHTHTPRTYSVTRTGWNKIAEAVSKLQ